MNAHLLFDKRAYVDRLKASGVDELQARAHADGLEQAFREEVVTKSDLAAHTANMDAKFAQMDAKFDAKFAQIDTKFAQVDAKFDAKFALLDAKFAQIDTKFAAVRTDIQQSQNRILLTIITVSFALLGAIKYLN